ncbi:hypothetical protein CL614_01965 [archaeon]|nr:hypothetical protein [archaeon]|tara:strand:+ start:290 stop:610 length:321 start_codon:yes stop_codon:yes gene_type:complete
MALILTTIDSVPGKKIVQTLGVVKANTVRAKHVGKDFVAGLKNIAGGELHEYTDLLKDSREQAIQRLEANATAMGADAVVNIRFTTSSIMRSASEILVYGTAVKLK